MWSTGGTTPEMITIVFLLLILLSLWVGFYQLFKQQGRILLRLDELESRTSTASHRARNTRVQRLKRPGCPCKVNFLPSVFRTLQEMSCLSTDFRGRRVLLVNWNFECGFCDSIAPQLASLEPSFQRRNVQLLLLAHGESAPNREGAAEHGLKCPILLVGGREEGGAFETEGTPVAYLVDEDGRVAAPVARGADRVLALALELAGPQPGALRVRRTRRSTMGMRKRHTPPRRPIRIG